MHTNYTNRSKDKKLIYPELSYTITGVCFYVHNNLGRFARERQYCDKIEARFKELNIEYKREYRIGNSRNIIDFLIDDKVILETKAKKIILKADYYQTQRYLQTLNKKLGLIVNFRDRYLKPKRIVKIETDTKEKFK